MTYRTYSPARSWCVGRPCGGAATGPNSEIGRIGQTLGEIETTPAHLTRQTARLVRVAGVGGLVCCCLSCFFMGCCAGHG